MRMSRRYKSRTRRLRPIGKLQASRCPAKSRTVATSNGSTKAINVIHITECIVIAKATTLTNSYQVRESDHVNVKGFRMFKSIRNNANEPLWCHIAIMTSKVHDDDVAISDAARTEMTEEFWRDTVSNRVTDLDFTAQSSAQFMNNTINTDRWIILGRWKKLLAANITGFDNRKRHWHWKKYIKFNRQLTFDNTNDKPESGRTFLVYWFHPVFKNALVAPTIDVEPTVQNDIRIFFKEAPCLY